MTFLSLRSFTKPPLASVLDGWRLHQHPPASVHHPQPGLRRQRRGTPCSSTSGGIHVTRSAERGTSLWRHCDRGGRRPTCRQQLAVWGWCFLQLGLPRSRGGIAKMRGPEPWPPAMMDRDEINETEADMWEYFKRPFLMWLVWKSIRVPQGGAFQTGQKNSVKMHLFFNCWTRKVSKTRLLFVTKCVIYRLCKRLGEMMG